MFGKPISLFSLFGFKVKLDVSWFILGILIAWSLATGVFPEYLPGLGVTAYWWMGIAGSLGLLVSIVFHEFCHSIVARYYGLSMKGITLFIFGGVAEMENEPESPKVEFLMALAGPVSSVLLSGVFYALVTAGKSIGWAKPANGVLGYLAWINLILAGFNLVPAFPLDGGRILRSILWAVKHNLRWATHIASSLGSAFGILLIVLGVINFIGGNFIGGLWYFLIGMFVRSASQMSYRQLIIRKALAGEHVGRFMKSEPISVSPSITLSELVQDYFYKYHYKMFPVLENGQVKGCVSTKEVKQIPHERWSDYRVADIVKPCSRENTVSVQEDAIKALSLMSSTGNSRLMVLDGEKIAGVVTLKDLLQFLALKIDLEEKDEIKIPY
ncbi:MAG: site-2 protease family protein [Sedimentisphaerales bacterium]